MASNIVSLVIGSRGVGKTDFLKNKVIKPSPLPKKLIVDTFDSDIWRNMKTFENPQYEAIEIPLMELEQLEFWKKGIYRIANSEPNLVFTNIDENLKNALVVFEDSTKYIGSKLTPSTRKFIYDSKQKNLNLTFVFHSLGSVPPELVRAADILTLFKTNEGHPNKTKYPFPEIPVVMEHLRESENRYENITIRLN